MIYFLSAQITQQSHAIVWNVFYLSKIATDIDALLLVPLWGRGISYNELPQAICWSMADEHMVSSAREAATCLHAKK